MTLLLDERYETGPDGATLDTTNTAFTAVGGTSTNGARTFTSSSPHEGSLCGEYVAGSTTGSMWTRYDPPTALATVYLRAYVRFVTVFPGNNTGIVYWRNASGTVRARVEVNNNGSFTIKNGTTVVATSTVTTALDTWCRLEWQLINGTGQALRIFVGANVDGTTPDETITGTFNTGTDGQQLLIGWAGPLSNRTMRMDAVAVDDAAWIGPLSTGVHGTTTLNLTATLTASGHALGGSPHGTSSLTTAATLTASGRKVGRGNSILEFAPTLSASGHAVTGAHGTSSLPLTAALTASGRKMGHGSASVVDTASLTASGHKAALGTTVLTSPAALTATGHAIGSKHGSTVLTTAAALTASGHRVAHGTSGLTVAASLTARGFNPAVPDGVPVQQPTLTLDVHDQTLTLTTPPPTLTLGA